jgi:hypothetical protein
MRKRPYWSRVRAGLACLVGVALLAGCGGSGGDGDDGSLTKEEWIAEADALCKQSLAEVNAIPEPKTEDDFDEYLTDVLAAARRFDPEFAALEPPEGDEETVRKLVALNEEKTRLFEELVAAVRAQDAAKVQRIVNEGTAKTNEFAAAARAYGSEECAKTDAG